MPESITYVYFEFRNGDVSKYAEPVCDNDRLSDLDALKRFILDMIRMHVLSGTVKIELRDGIFFTDFNIQPKKFESDLRQAVNSNFYVFEKAAFA